MKDNDGWETISTVGQPASNDGWETIPVTETPEYRSSYNQLREDALRVGYSGLTPEQKEMIKSAYPQSLAGKAGLSFEEMAAKMDAQATEQPKEQSGLAGWFNYALPEMPKAGYQAAKDVAAQAFGPVFGSVEYALNQGLGRFGEVNKEDRDRSWSETVDNSKEAARKGEGLVGIAADPLNILSFGPTGRAISSGITKGLERIIPSAMNKTVPRGVASVLSNAVEGGAYGAADAYLNDRDIGSSLALGAGVGGVIGGASDIAKSYSKHTFPGLNSQKNRNLDQATVDIVSDNFDRIMSPGILPKTKEGFYDMADKAKGKLSKHYDAAIEAVEAQAARDAIARNLSVGGRHEGLGAAGVTPDLTNKAIAQLKREMSPEEWKEYIQSSGVDIPLMTTLDYVKEDLQKEFKTKLARRNALSESAEKLLEKDVDAVKRSREYLGDPDAIAPKDLSLIRTDKTNPETYKDPVAEMALARKDLGSSWREAINNFLESDYRYSEHVTPKVKEEYKLWKSLENVLDNPGRMGLGDRLGPLNLTLSPYLKSSTAYRLGDALSLGVSVRPAMFKQTDSTKGSTEK